MGFKNSGIEGDFVVDGSIILNGSPIQSTQNIVWVGVKADLPTPSGGVITLADNETYFVMDTVDLTGDRLLCGENTTILGASSENCRIKSTGLVTALITSSYSLPMRNIAFESDLVFDLNASGYPTGALDWTGVNLVNCAEIGTIANYSNFIMSDSAILSSKGLSFDGTFGTIGFSNSLLQGDGSGTIMSIEPTAIITRRLRMIYSSIVSFGGSTGLFVSPTASIGTESYILDTINFSGGATYIAGVDVSDNKTLFSNCAGINNTSVNGQLYMQDNATASTITTSSVFVKVDGNTTPSTDNEKYTATNNRLTNDAVIERKYLIQCNLSFNSGNNQVCEFGFYDSKLAGIRTPSRTKSTANAAGRAENVSMADVVNHSVGDYIEIWCANTTGTTNITVSDMNVVITQII